jgi:hypothetical protein
MSDHRRITLSLVAQLPDTKADALVVIEHMRRIVDVVFDNEPPTRRVLAFERGEKGA